MSNTKTVMGQASNQYVKPLEVEDVFSTYLYSGNNQNGTVITNGIDLEGEGGLIWIKRRNAGTEHLWQDSERGAGTGTSYKQLFSNLTSAQNTTTNEGVTSFNSNGFTIDSGGDINQTGNPYASWTFRKAPKFFDVVTYTGDGVAGRTVSHNLGTTVGSIFVKRTNDTGHWYVYHRSTGSTGHLVLNLTDSFTTFSGGWNDTNPTDTEFTLGNSGYVNANGDSYVAYIFAHNDGDGGFNGGDIIKCGSYTGTGAAGNQIDLGFEPQWLMVKSSTGNQNWEMFDNMRGVATGGSAAELFPNTSSSERTGFNIFNFNATGFETESTLDETNENGQTYIYMAIRRGTKVPESGTEVFDVYTGSDAYPTVITTGFTVDSLLGALRSGNSNNFISGSRLTGSKSLITSSTAAQGNGLFSGSTNACFMRNDGILPSAFGTSNTVYYSWKRAPGYFDAVAYTGNQTAGLQINHNLAAIPEMMWVKNRGATEPWAVYHKDIGNTKSLRLNGSNVVATENFWNGTTPTETVFTLGANSEVNFPSGTDYIAYLFASLDGISKVGSYVGTGNDLDIDCGFTSGARFVLIKNTNEPEHWILFDTVRGITTGTSDPYLMPSLDYSERTSTAVDIDPLASGFRVASNGPHVNGVGDTHIFYAIA